MLHSRSFDSTACQYIGANLAMQLKVIGAEPDRPWITDWQIVFGSGFMVDVCWTDEITSESVYTVQRKPDQAQPGPVDMI